MVFIAIDPKTNKIKEYKNSGEWLKEVDQAKTTIEKPIEVKTFADANDRAKKELGINLVPNDFYKNNPMAKAIEQGVALAMRRNETEQAELKAKIAALEAQASKDAYDNLRGEVDAHSPLAGRENHFDNRTVAEIIEDWRNFRPAGCRCAQAAKHSQKAEVVIHSQYGHGPVMEARPVTWEEAQSRLREAGVEI